MNATTAAANANFSQERVRFWASFRQMPAVLQAYACFTLLVFLSGGLALAALVRSAHGLTTPWTNSWSAVWHQMYLLTFSVLGMCPNPALNQWRKVIQGSLCGLLVGALLIGIGDMLSGLSAVRVTLAAQNAGPGFQYAPLRPVLYVVVPAFWILMLLSPQIWRWQTGKAPVALVDLFYWVFVVAACMLLSIVLVGHARHRLEVGQTIAEMLAKSKAASQASPSPAKTP